MKNLRDSIKLFRFNLLYTILFEVILKTVSFAVLLPLYFTFINVAVKLSGIPYLSKETAARFFRAPSTYAILFIMLAVAAAFLIIEFSGISYAYSRANYLKKTSPIRMLGYGIKTAFRTLRPRNIPVLVFIVCFLPTIGTIILSYEFMNIRAPYLVDITSVNMYVTIALVALYVIYVFYNFRHIFLLHIFNVEKTSYRGAVDIERDIIKGKRLRQIGATFFACILFIVIPYVLDILYRGNVLEFVLGIPFATKVWMMIYEVIKTVSTFSYVILGLPLMMAYICNSYYNLVPEEEGPNIDDYEEYDSRKSSKRERKIFVVVMCVALLVDLGFYGLKRYNIISVNANYLSKVTITAHRGDCINAPENTLSAFDKAIEKGADVVELDVRQTKDGEVVVMHDESLRRTCGVKKKVGKLTYEQILKYSPAKKFKGKNKEEFVDEKIPTLRQVFELVGDRAQLNIEIKPAKTDTDLEQKVVELIQEYDYYDNCVVTSPTYGSIKKIKLLDPNIKTVYVMSVAMGDFASLPYADAFSIKYRYVNTEVVKKVHELDKEVYVWTVDNKDVLENMMLLDVDSIITNKPKEMRNAMYENYYGDTLLEKINGYIENQL